MIPERPGTLLLLFFKVTYGKNIKYTILTILVYNLIVLLLNLFLLLRSEGLIISPIYCDFLNSQAFPTKHMGNKDKKKKAERREEE